MSSPSSKSRSVQRRDSKPAVVLTEAPEGIHVGAQVVQAVYPWPPRYPIARLLIIVLRVFAIIVACLWPIESILIALIDEPYPGLARPLTKFIAIVSLLVLHFLFLVGLLCWSELLQAFLDIAKNTEETAQQVSRLAESKSRTGEKTNG